MRCSLQAFGSEKGLMHKAAGESSLRLLLTGGYEFICDVYRSAKQSNLVRGWTAQLILSSYVKVSTEDQFWVLYSHQSCKKMGTWYMCVEDTEKAS